MCEQRTGCIRNDCTTAAPHVHMADGRRLWETPDSLRARIAELEALLRDARGYTLTALCEPGMMTRRIDAALGDV